MLSRVLLGAVDAGVKVRGRTLWWFRRVENAGAKKAKEKWGLDSGHIGQEFEILKTTDIPVGWCSDECVNLPRVADEVNLSFVFVDMVRVRVKGSRTSTVTWQEVMPCWHFERTERGARVDIMVTVLAAM